MQVPRPSRLVGREGIDELGERNITHAMHRQISKSPERYPRNHWYQVLLIYNQGEEGDSDEDTYYIFYRDRETHEVLKNFITKLEAKGDVEQVKGKEKPWLNPFFDKEISKKLGRTVNEFRNER